mgnify:CR=1 FL=1|tara:strand:- start:491 stop:769 length:279 start_codon:yes stop_codon:yes gene_type:complete
MKKFNSAKWITENKHGKPSLEEAEFSPQGRIVMDKTNFDNLKELMEEVLNIVQEMGPSLHYDAITVESKIQELIKMMNPEQRAKDQTTRRGY